MEASKSSKVPRVSSCMRRFSSWYLPSRSPHLVPAQSAPTGAHATVWSHVSTLTIKYTTLTIKYTTQQLLKQWKQMYASIDYT